MLEWRKPKGRDSGPRKRWKVSRLSTLLSRIRLRYVIFWFIAFLLVVAIPAGGVAALHELQRGFGSWVLATFLAIVLVGIALLVTHVARNGLVVGGASPAPESPAHPKVKPGTANQPVSEATLRRVTKETIDRALAGFSDEVKAAAADAAAKAAAEATANAVQEAIDRALAGFNDQVKAAAAEAAAKAAASAVAQAAGPRWKRAAKWSLTLLAGAVLSLVLGYFVPTHDASSSTPRTPLPTQSEEYLQAVTVTDGHTGKISANHGVARSQTPKELLTGVLRGFRSPSVIDAWCE
jgi:hypothetical protein